MNFKSETLKLLQKMLTVTLAFVMMLSVSQTTVLGYANPSENETEINISIYKTFSNLPETIPIYSMPKEAVASDIDYHDESGAEFVLYKYENEVIGEEVAKGVFAGFWSNPYTGYKQTGRYDFTWKEPTNDYQGGTYALVEKTAPIGKDGRADDEFYIVTVDNIGEISNISCSKSSFSDTLIYGQSSQKWFIYNEDSQKYDLTISKSIFDPEYIDNEEEYEFDVKLTAPEGERLDTEYTVKNTYNTSSVSVKNGHMTLKLKAYEQSSIQGLPEGTQYEITEVDSKGYKPEFSSMDDLFNTSENFKGILTKETYIRCTNRAKTISFNLYKSFTTIKEESKEPNPTPPIYSLPIADPKGPSGAEFTLYEYDEKTSTIGKEITKSVLIEADSDLATYQFTWELNDNEIFTGGPYVLKETKSPIGKQSFNDDEYWIIHLGTTLPYKYMVYSIKGSTDEMNKLCYIGESTINLYIFNLNDVQTHNLTIEKEVTVPVEGSDQFEFDIELTAPKGGQLDNAYEVAIQDINTTKIQTGESVVVKDGHMTVTLSKNQKAIIKGLPEGTQYRVKERVPDGYQSTWTDDLNSGTLSQDTILHCKNQSKNIRFSVYKTLGYMNIPAPVYSLTPAKDVEPTAGTIDPNKASGAELVLYEYNHDEGIGKEVAKGVYIEDYLAFSNYLTARFDFTWEDTDFKGGTYAIKELMAPAGAAPLSDDDFWIVNLKENGHINSISGSNTKMNGLFGYGSMYDGHWYLFNPFAQEKTISIQKKVISKHIDTDKEFIFTVDLKAPKGGRLESSYRAEFYDADTDFSSPDDIRRETLPVVNGQITFKLKHNEVVDLFLKEGLTYTINEVETKGYTTNWSEILEWNDDGYTTAQSERPSDTLTPDDDYKMFICTNTLQTGSLTVNKTVTGAAADKEKAFTFTVTLDDASINGTYGDMFFQNGNAEFTLKDGQELTATDLPVGIKYQVKERDNEGYTVTTENDEGIITLNEEAKVNFINNKEYHGGLRVTNHVTGKGDKQKDFHYTVDLHDESINGWYGDMYFENGKAEFDLKDGQNLTATGLPEDLSYSVTETDNEGYVTTMDGETGSLLANEIVDIVFINDKGNNAGLKISNTVTGKGSQEKNFHYTVELEDSSITGQYGDLFFKNGKAEFDMKHGESKTATGLPDEVKFTVTETDNEGYTVTMNGETQSLVDNEILEVEFINHLDEMTDIPLVDEETPKPSVNPNSMLDSNNTQSNTNRAVNTSDNTSIIRYGMYMLGSLMILVYFSKRKQYHE